MNEGDRKLLVPFRAVVADLDGVVTDTASVHMQAWKETFDPMLDERGQRPFDEQDYRRYVDGKPRHAGVQSFLGSRQIDVADGDPSDGPECETIWGLGNRKNQRFHELLERDGARVYDDAVRALRHWREVGMRTAMVSSSRNAARILTATGLDDLFDVRVDGVVGRDLGLPGKPAPDYFLEAARQLGVAPSEAMVLEDAVSGVEAGKRGGFGLVVGVARGPSRQALFDAGADHVVGNFAELMKWPATLQRRRLESWRLLYDDYDAAEQPLREALCTVGNGFFATRGAFEERSAGGAHYPGTYLAGGYNRARTYLGERWVENEDLVNWPNWLCLSFRPAEGEWLDLDKFEVLSFQQELDLARGVLVRRVRLRDESERETDLVSRRIVHMGCPHLAALQWELVPRNWSGRVHVRSALDGNVINAGVERYRELESRHLEVLEAGSAAEDVVYLTTQTRQSHLRVSQAARTQVFLDGEPAALERHVVQEGGYIGHELVLDVDRGRSLEVEKVVALYTLRDHAITEPQSEAVRSAERADRFTELEQAHGQAWQRLWRRCDIGLDHHHPAQAILRLHILHLLQSVSPHSIELDVGVTSRGLHGEAYRGHVFWDELFIFPMLSFRLPEVTRTLLMYRYRRLPEARRAARDAGYEGAMFPWQSGSNGREESQTLHLNPRSGRWIPDETHLQRHVSSAIAHNIWQYFQASGDIEFLTCHGAEMLLEIARFWASLATYDETRERYRIRGVVGPDEFHTRYPGSDRPGLDDNAYTNVMAAWVLRTALHTIDVLSEHRVTELLAQLGMTHDDINRFRRVAERMYVPFHDGLISQFEGYENLRELDWKGYERKYGNIQRLDRILEAEGDDINVYKASKQADVLMLFYLFSADELETLLTSMGYAFRRESISDHIDYYTERSSYGSSLSRVVFAWVTSRADRAKSWALFTDALRSDIEDVQGGTTAEGIHLGAMAGTVDIVQRCYIGMEARDEVLWLNPRLPQELPCVELHLRYRGSSLDLEVRHDWMRVTFREGRVPSIRVAVAGEVYRLEQGETREFDLHRDE
ncbi:MAG: beta-phosphoglucomutase family hydrolase [Myxococcota bacterium]